MWWCQRIKWKLCVFIGMGVVFMGWRPCFLPSENQACLVLRMNVSEWNIRITDQILQSLLRSDLHKAIVIKKSFGRLLILMLSWDLSIDVTQIMHKQEQSWDLKQPSLFNCYLSRNHCRSFQKIFCRATAEIEKIIYNFICTVSILLW